MSTQVKGFPPLVDRDTAQPKANKPFPSTDRTAKPNLRIGSPVCQCPTCDLYFSGPSVFDRHLIAGGLRCRTPEQMRDHGMETNEHGVWLWGMSEKQAKAGKP